ncbi:MAG: hypothetical protein AAGF97_17065 [Planctomycetota bacterium]
MNCVQIFAVPNPVQVVILALTAAVCCTPLQPVTAQTVVFSAQADFMSSGFFTSDFLRGEEASSPRDTNRVTSEVIFGVPGETAYFGFDFNPAAFSGPVSQATFSVENVTAGFFPDVSDSNPAEISLHRLTADPLTAVNQSLASGPGSWVDFRDAQIVTDSIVDTISISGFGENSWDVTALINEWIANGDTNFAYTLGTSALLDPEGDAAVAFVNSSFSGLTGNEVTAQISVLVPETATVGPLLLAAFAWMFRHHKR